MTEKDHEIEKLFQKFVRELKERFPASRVTVTPNSNGVPVAYVDGVKVIDMEQIIAQLKSLSPTPKNTQEPKK